MSRLTFPLGRVNDDGPNRRRVHWHGSEVFFVLVLLPAVAQGAIVTDPDFGPHWTSFHITIGVGRSSEGATNELTGGNPDKYRKSSHTHGGISPNDVLSWFFNFDTSNVFDPSKGAITDVSFAFDGIISQSSSGAAQFGPALLQNGRIFHYDTKGPGQGTLNAWRRFETNSLTAADFDPTEPAFPNGSVDFSPTGAPIQFGYFSLTGGFVTASAMTGADNWRLEVNAQHDAAVPEPSSMAAWLILGAVGLVGARYRRRRTAQDQE